MPDDIIDKPGRPVSDDRSDRRKILDEMTADAAADDAYRTVNSYGGRRVSDQDIIETVNDRLLDLAGHGLLLSTMASERGRGLALEVLAAIRERYAIVDREELVVALASAIRAYIDAEVAGGRTADRGINVLQRLDHEADGIARYALTHESLKEADQ